MVALDNILSQVTKAVRYAGNEWNSAVKDWDKVEVRVALAYPDLYEIGMSYLGLPILYDLLNRQTHVLAERVYAPWFDMEAAMRRAGMPLFSLESKHPLGDFDIIGFSLGYELTYTNVLNMLDLAGIPVLHSQRTGSEPLIIAGGGCALNPEPMADFIDLFAIGDGEEVLLELIEVYCQHGRSEATRDQAWKQRFLRQAAAITGIYVPSFYHVDTNKDGTISRIEPAVSEASPTIKRRLVAKLPPPVTAPVVPYMQVIHDRAAIEIQRGCTRGCRFCQASTIYRPLRQRSMEEITTAADELLRNSGYDELSLVSLNTTDYFGIEEVVNALSSRYRGKNVALSLPSLRVDSSLLRLIDGLSGQRKTGLTFAPEAGSQRLRKVINKPLEEEQLLETLELAMHRGWNTVKLYFMVGLPTETEEDIQGVIDLMEMVWRVGKRRDGRSLRARVSVSTFVPKAHTPFQWVAQDLEEKLAPKQHRLRRGLRRMASNLSWSDPQMSQLEAVLARGDRRLSKVIHRAWQLGCTFDAWSERFDFSKWLRAFEDCGLSPEFYANRERSLDEVLPWSHIDIGISTAFFKREYLRAIRGKETPDCRLGQCAVCGLQRWDANCAHKYEQMLHAAKKGKPD